MSRATTTIETIHWHGCYRGSWQGEIVEAAFSHPAKFARGLIRRIYRHMIERGYVRPGDKILDPFAGVALGALDAMRYGMHWQGVELEQAFVDLAQQNIDLWTGRYADWFPTWGTARVVQGDSRRLLAVLQGADCAVSSPPFGDRVSAEDIEFYRKIRVQTGRNPHSPHAQGINSYGSSPGQLGAMPEGDVDAVVSSSPFSPPKNQPTGRGQGVRSDYKNGLKKEESPDSDYGGSPGQLGTMPMTDLDAAISSPAYGDTVDGSGEGPGARHDYKHHAPDNATKSSSAPGYGRTPGNLGNMPGYDAAVSSSPFTGTHASEQSEEFYRARGKTGKTTGTVGQEYAEKIPYEKRGFLMGKEEYKRWSQSCNLGSITTSQETFWGEARVILEQTFAALKPGGVAAWVTGNFRRNGQIVDFGGQWLALCEAVGFVGLECITAWKVEPGPTQFGMFVEDRDLTIERTSFFRRLDNQRNPDAPINSEQVWIVQKPGASK